MEHPPPGRVLLPGLILIASLIFPSATEGARGPRCHELFEPLREEVDIPAYVIPDGMSFLIHPTLGDPLPNLNSKIFPTAHYERQAAQRVPPPISASARISEGADQVLVVASPLDKLLWARSLKLSPDGKQVEAGYLLAVDKDGNPVTREVRFHSSFRESTISSDLLRQDFAGLLTEIRKSKNRVTRLLWVHVHPELKFTAREIEAGFAEVDDLMSPADRHVALHLRHAMDALGLKHAELEYGAVFKDKKDPDDTNGTLLKHVERLIHEN